MSTGVLTLPRKEPPSRKCLITRKGFKPSCLYLEYRIASSHKWPLHGAPDSVIWNGERLTWEIVHGANIIVHEGENVEEYREGGKRKRTVRRTD